MAGRPLKFESVEVIEQLANDYFDSTPKEEWTITGLALALDTSRETLMNYEERPEFFDTIKKLKTKIENQYEISLRKYGRSGDIFALKNFDWSDKTQQDIRYPDGIDLVFDKWPSLSRNIETKGGQLQNQNGTKMLHTKGGDIPM